MSMGLKVGPGLFEKVAMEGIDLNLRSNQLIYSAAYYHPELDIPTPVPQ